MSFRAIATALVLLGLLVFGGYQNSEAKQPDQSFNPQSEFNRGNFLLEQRNYVEALEVYTEIENRGYESGPLFLNMGMAFARMDSLGPALFYFDRAENFTQTRTQAGEGMYHVRNILDNRYAPIPVLATYELDRRLHQDIGLATPLLVFFILLNLAALVWVAGWFLSKRRTVLRYVSYTIFFFALASLVTAGYIYEQRDRYEYGMIVENGHLLYENPDMDSEPVLRLYEGYTFRLDRRESPEGSGWVRVQMSNGLEGWVRDRGFRVY